MFFVRILEGLWVSHWINSILHLVESQLLLLLLLIRNSFNWAKLFLLNSILDWSIGYLNVSLKLSCGITLGLNKAAGCSINKLCNSEPNIACESLTIGTYTCQE